MASTKYIVTAKTATIRKKPDIQSTKLKIVSKGQILTCTSSKNAYYYVSNYKGYIQKEAVKKYTGSSTNKKANPEVKIAATKSSFDEATAKKLLTTNLTGIYGMPYQFMDTVDRRIDDETNL